MAQFNVISGVQRTAIKTLIYGPEGIGKSTLAAMWPNPIFIDLEGGTNQLPVVRLESPSSLSMLRAELTAIKNREIPCSTVVIDTMDAAERMCAEYIMARDGKKSIEEWGYGKGYTILQEEFGRLLDYLTDTAASGINVVVLGHSTMRKFERPDESGAYDRFELKLTKQVSPMVKEWADMVLFCDYKTYVETNKSGKAKATGGARVIRTTHAPTWDAKNRFGLPDELPLKLGEMPVQLGEVIPDMVAEQAAAAPAAPVATVAPTAPQTAVAVPAAPVQAEPTTTLTTTTTTTATDEYSAPDYPERMKKLVDLMVANKVTDAELRDAVGKTGNFPAECSPVDYPEGFADYLVSGWDTVMNKYILPARAVEAAKNAPVPFN